VTRKLSCAFSLRRFSNVAEWTDSSYDAASYEYVSMNPILSEYSTNEVVRGGSWKDVSYYLQVATKFRIPFGQVICGFPYGSRDYMGTLNWEF
jgi:hypothetical protein